MELEFKAGDLVTVTPQYVGGGRYRNDEWTGGPYTVVKVLKPWDYKLARGVRLKPYDVIVHECRVKQYRDPISVTGHPMLRSRSGGSL